MFSLKLPCIIIDLEFAKKCHVWLPGMPLQTPSAEGRKILCLRRDRWGWGFRS